MDNEVKPGYKTTEFYIVIIGSVLSIAVAAGVLSGQEAQEITIASTEVINALTALAGALAPILGTVAYIWSRTRVKVGK